MPVEPPKPKCKICRRVKQEANRWFRIERIEEEGRAVGMRWQMFTAEDVHKNDADFVCGPGCLAKETCEIAQWVIEEERRRSLPAPENPSARRKREPGAVVE
ncbi:MAG: hypothetical protein ACLGSD_04010 [Acidobacteriota bacterium]